MKVRLFLGTLLLVASCSAVPLTRTATLAPPTARAADPQPGPVSPPTVKLPAEVKVVPGRLAAVTVVWSGEDIRWDVPPDLDCFREYDPDPKQVRLRLIGYAPGKYRLIAVAAAGGKLSDFSACVIVVGDPVPPVPPTPPVPPVPPVPPQPPAPIPGSGLRVLIVYESSELAKMPAAQQTILYGASIRTYLNAKCPTGADGKTKEWRIWDKDTDASNEAQVWRDALKRPRTAVPWLIVSNGVSGFEGPLPNTLDEAMTVLKKYGGD